MTTRCALGWPKTRLAIILDNFSPHLTTKTDTRVGDYADAHNIELVYVPFNASWLNRIEAQFTGLRYFALHGTDHPFHKQQGRAIRRYIAWRNRNRNPHDRRLRRIVERASRETRLVPRDGSVRRGRGAPERGGTA